MQRANDLRLGGLWIGASLLLASGCSSHAPLTSDASTCETGHTACAGACVDTATDPTNCGGCGTKCAAGQVCSNSACALFCAGGSTQCGQSCVNVQFDPLNCGACSTRCGSGKVCANGTCASSCGALATCGTGADGGSALYCANTSADNQNCGRCANLCPAGTACSSGNCGTTCGSNQTLCTPDAGAAYCSSTGTDRGNCGACFRTCSTGEVCANGTCAISCPATQINCSGACVDPQTSGQNCGATEGCGTDGGTAGMACGAGAVCALGTCGPSCPPAEIVCAGECVDPSVSDQYCGATEGCGTDGGTAGMACGTGAVCALGTCGVSCPPAEIVCGGECVDPSVSNQYCGATAGCGVDGGSAGMACDAGLVCSTGGCGPTCAPPLLSCGGGCVDPNDDPLHCGGCNACPTKPNVAVALCTSAMCFVSTCALNTADCNGLYADGCEVNTNGDPNNCGRCGHVCSGTGALCTNGGCALCGNGILEPGEQCDDGNTIDTDACTNACTLGPVVVGGTAPQDIKAALTALGETYTTAPPMQWAPSSGIGTIILSNDGYTGAMLDYTAHLDAGAHLLVVGGSNLAAYSTWVANYVNTDVATNGSTWHESNDCMQDWNKLGGHPITQLLPTTYEFINGAGSPPLEPITFHMMHFPASQPGGATVIGYTCHNVNPGILVTRRYPSQGTFTANAFDLGAYVDANSQAGFLMPFLKGYLAYLRGPH